MTDAADDFDALFDEVSAQRNEALAAAVPAAASAPIAEKTEEPARNKETEEAEDQSLFDRLGGIVRILHDSLRALGYDRSLSTVATQINDAHGRLEYIATLTEQAATKVLNAIDVGIPEQDSLQKKAKDMNVRWTALFEGKIGVDEFKALAGDSKQFAAAVGDATEAEKARLLEIMMAQDFQDLTGQLIKKILSITQLAEKELAQLLRDYAPPEMKTTIAAVETKPVELLHGPSTPTVAMEQDDVDNLLADLGF
ncbi:MAG: protein phosphatase CheZ [Burkholderiales bacterium]